MRAPRGCARALPTIAVDIEISPTVRAVIELRRRERDGRHARRRRCRPVCAMHAQRDVLRRSVRESRCTDTDCVGSTFCEAGRVVTELSGDGTTFFDPSVLATCSGYNPGWTIRLRCHY
jgi:hypothetical protein